MPIKRYVMPSEAKHEKTIKMNEKLNKLNSVLPKPPFFFLIQGSVGSGKTSLLYSLLRNYQKINYFDIIYIYNRVKDSDKVWQTFEKYKIIKKKNKEEEIKYITSIEIYNDYDNKQLKNLIDAIDETQTQRRTEGKRPLNILFVFDDMAYSGITKRASAPSSLDQLIINRRHYNISIVITSQTYKALSMNARTNNLTHMVLMKANKKDLELIAEDHNAGEVSTEDFIIMYKTIKKGNKYDFLVVDYTDEQERRFKKNFEEVIEIVENEEDDTLN